MLRTDIPLRFQLAWAANAAGAYIRTVPVASQIGIQDGAASFNDGFVPDNFTALAGGGVPPFGQDFNGLLNVTTSWDVWYQAGAPISYNSTFSTAHGGYPQGAKVDSAVVLGAQWYSLTDSNTTDPDDPLTSANWARVGLPAGTPVPFLQGTVPTGFVPMNGTTIGSAASNATGRANADTLFAYIVNWALSATVAPIYTSAGVLTTRGANAVADFLANKALTVPSMRGTNLTGVDTMGGGTTTNLAGVPVSIGNTTTPGSVLGANLQGLVTANLPVVTPSGSITNGAISISHNANSQNSSSSTGGGGFAIPAPSPASISASQAPSIFTGASFGSNTAHNNVSLTMLVTWGQKL